MRCGFCRKRRVMVDQIGGRREVLAVRDQRALGMPGGARGVDDEGRIVRREALHLRFEPVEVAVSGRRAGRDSS